MRQSDVVGVHPRDVRAARDLQADVERARQAERRVVPDDAQPLVGDPGEHVAGVVRRAVVDDDELEVAVRLVQNAPRGLLDRGAGVTGREHDGDERRAGHGGSEGSLRRWLRTSSRHSISSWRRSIGRSLSTRFSRRWADRPIATFGC